MLGQLLDTARGVIELPPHRAQRLQEALAEVTGKRRISLRVWRRLLGELRSMVVALPGGEGLFSHLQAALVGNKGGRITVTKHVRDELADWKWVADSLVQRPTSIAETVQKPATRVGAVDAAKPGMGGVLFDLNDEGQLTRPRLWRDPFPPDIQRRFLSFDNPKGDITNSDCELAGVVAHQDVAAQTTDVRHRTIGTTLCDNTPSVAWTLRGSVLRHSVAAYLLRLLALHRRHYRYSVAIAHIAGVANQMADDCSRLWHLSDAELLAYF
ncbi:hypothetical protein ACHAWF_001001, partial [Thalassiosira exigua]